MDRNRGRSTNVISVKYLTLEKFFVCCFQVLVSLDGEILLKAQILLRIQLPCGLRLAAEREGCPMAAGSFISHKAAGLGSEPGQV